MSVSFHLGKWEVLVHFLFPKHKIERMPALLEIDGRHFARKLESVRSWT